MKNIRFCLFAFTLPALLFFNWSLIISTNQNKNTNSDEKKLIQLGRMLFYDPILSGDNTISCASCHKQQFAFADTAKFSRGIQGRLTKRNTMSLVNLKWSEQFFWDGRAKSLEEQVLFPIQDSLEMGQDLKELERELNNNTKYKKLFFEIFASDEIEISQVTGAISEFVKSIESKNTKSEEIIDSLTKIDKTKVFEMLFKDYSENTKAALLLCQECHNGKLYGGVLIKNNGLSFSQKDQGLGNITGKSKDMGVFKATTFRNIRLTAPYMHDGRFNTLEEVFQYYNNGIQNHSNLDSLLMKEGKPIKLNLSEKEISDIIKFLELMTDTVVLTNPAYSNPFQ